MAAGGAGGAGTCTPPTDAVGNDGCVTFGGASAMCGEANGFICDFAVDCGVSTGDVGQCQINCSQGVDVGTCYTQADVDCVYNAAVCDGSCTDLAACNWPFF